VAKGAELVRGNRTPVSADNSFLAFERLQADRGGPRRVA
jgi:hypothetical protein